MKSQFATNCRMRNRIFTLVTSFTVSLNCELNIFFSRQKIIVYGLSERQIRMRRRVGELMNFASRWSRHYMPGYWESSILEFAMNLNGAGRPADLKCEANTGEISLSLATETDRIQILTKDSSMPFIQGVRCKSLDQRIFICINEKSPKRISVFVIFIRRQDEKIRLPKEPERTSSIIILICNKISTVYCDAQYQIKKRFIYCISM